MSSFSLTINMPTYAWWIAAVMFSIYVALKIWVTIEERRLRKLTDALRKLEEARRK